MKPEELKLSDLQRILIGEIPPMFFVELIFRAAILYIVLILGMRLMGKRMASQIGRNEMAAVVSLAAAVGIPLMNPDRGLLPGILIVLVIVIFTVIISKISSRNETFEAITQDDLSVLLTDGVMDLAAMKKNRVTRERLFSQLRMLQKTHLGTVKRVYMEANGLFSIVDEHESIPGLSIIPHTDQEFFLKKLTETDNFACNNCGKIGEGLIASAWTHCKNCGAVDWKNAVLLQEKPEA